MKFFPAGNGLNNVLPVSGAQIGAANTCDRLSVTLYSSYRLMMFFTFAFTSCLFAINVWVVVSHLVKPR